MDKIENKERKKQKKIWRERTSRERKKKVSFLSKIYGNRTIGFHRSKRQSRSTHREQRVGTKILKFRQTP